MQTRLPFAMDPVVYDFEINDRGTWAELKENADQPLMPNEYYALLVPGWLQQSAQDLSALSRHELELLGTKYKEQADLAGLQQLVDSILPGAEHAAGEEQSLDGLLSRLGFDREQHEQIQTDLRSGRYGLAQNRLPVTTRIEDVQPDDVLDVRGGVSPALVESGKKAIANGEVAVITLAAGVGSRWTEGAGVVKGLHPFCQFDGRHRSFIEVHLAKSRRVGQVAGNYFPHVITTGYMTDDPIRQHLKAVGNYAYPGNVYVSPGRYVGLRMIPMARDLQFAWEEMPQLILDEQQEKMRASVRAALIGWARSMGEGNDYRENKPFQCLHPVGHWYEIPNMLRNGTLHRMLTEQPSLKHLMLHNVDTLGADVDPGMLGLHIKCGTGLTFEVISRRLEDRGGGLARVNGQPRLLEGLAIPREADEFKLSYYNSMTTWIDIDQMLATFELTRDQLSDQQAVDEGVRRLSLRLPTYITIKDVKKRWGNGQEDVFPVSQFEKLWSDMSGLSTISSSFAVVPLNRGQQLKEQSQLDGWLRDGSASYVEALCRWTD